MPALCSPVGELLPPDCILSLLTMPVWAFQKVSACLPCCVLCPLMIPILGCPLITFIPGLLECVYMLSFQSANGIHPQFSSL
jgi:hypothetical protein